MTVYHVTEKWNGKDLKSMAQIHGESAAIEIWCEKWDDCDVAFAAAHVNCIFFFGSREEAKDSIGTVFSNDAQILEIDAEYMDISTDIIEGELYTQEPVSAEFIRVIK